MPKQEWWHRKNYIYIKKKRKVNQYDGRRLFEKHRKMTSFILFHSCDKCLRSAVVSASTYESACPCLNPGQLGRNSTGCFSSLFELVDRIGSWANLGKVNCGGPGCHTSPVSRGDGFLPTACSKATETEISAEAKRSYSICSWLCHMITNGEAAEMNMLGNWPVLS